MAILSTGMLLLGFIATGAHTADGGGQQVHHKVFEEATKNLPAGVKAVASKLVQNAPMTQLVDCTKKDAYKVRGDRFRERSHLTALCGARQ
jgi:hypothetical protein